jgi:RND family efflux transporter MFP subunit
VTAGGPVKPAYRKATLFFPICPRFPASFHRTGSDWMRNLTSARVPSNLVILAPTCLAVYALLAGVSCSKKGPPANPPPPDVEVVRVEQKDVPIYGEWIGTLEGLVNADIKAQVTGYLIKQNYIEGSFVRKGELLFEIDPRPFQASLDQAQGQLAQATGQLEQTQAQLLQARAQVEVAEANQGRTQLDVERYIPLVKQEAVTKESLDNATQNNLAAKAQVQSAKAAVQTSEAQIVAAKAAVQADQAAVETARINLDFTRITSPIDGIAGVAQQQVGALVGQSSGALTTVSTVDPIKVYFTVSEQEYLDFTRRFPTEASRQVQESKMPLELILADGTIYPQKGRVYFADRQVDPATGSIRIAGLFANPGNRLRPGGYARIRTAHRVYPHALLVPQRAVIDLQGIYQVAVVDSGDKVSIRTVQVGDTVGKMWIINQGLKPGERVIAEGVQKVRAGMQVSPKPFTGAGQASRAKE